MTPRSVSLRDVTLRDGLQDEGPISTQDKLAIFEALVASGIRELELTSFVRPDRVPAMADAEALCAATADSEVTRWGLVLNERGARRALDAGLAHLQFVVSVSDSHSRDNAGRSTAQAMESLGEVCALVGQDVEVEVVFATAFGCPVEHRVDPARVAELSATAQRLGVRSVRLADTIGTAIPDDVRHLLSLVTEATTVTLGMHLHDTRGLGVANALAAFELGVSNFDAAVGGLGGCPFALGASGNVALEDLAHVFAESGHDTGLNLDTLVSAAQTACSILDKTVASHVGVAGRRFR